MVVLGGGALSYEQGTLVELGDVLRTSGSDVPMTSGF